MALLVKATYTVSLSSPSTVDTAVTITINNGSAESNDYIALLLKRLLFPQVLPQ
ncbi:hypothetical protein M0N77_13075 [Psychrobacter sp. AH5]|uniref:hypothetical protein n=1 Tax=Psychrobacter sp. AH5 TaxID=2937433 RepID=UPI0033428597